MIGIAGGFVITVDLLRHGAPKGGVRYRGCVDDPLTPEGYRQMERVWRQVHDQVDMIIASPLQRCAIPAAQWASARGIPCLIEPRVAEMHYGHWEGKTAAQIRQQWPGMLERWRRDPTGMRPPGGESPEALRERLQQWWYACIEQYDGQHVLLVAHSGSLRMLLAIVLQAPIAMTRHIDMPYAGWSRVGATREYAWLEFFNRY